MAKFYTELNDGLRQFIAAQQTRPFLCILSTGRGNR